MVRLAQDLGSLATMDPGKKSRKEVPKEVMDA